MEGAGKGDVEGMRLRLQWAPNLICSSAEEAVASVLWLEETDEVGPTESWPSLVLHGLVKGFPRTQFLPYGDCRTPYSQLAGLVRYTSALLLFFLLVLFAKSC